VSARALDFDVVDKGQGGAVCIEVEEDDEDDEEMQLLTHEKPVEETAGEEGEPQTENDGEDVSKELRKNERGKEFREKRYSHLTAKQEGGESDGGGEGSRSGRCVVQEHPLTESPVGLGKKRKHAEVMIPSKRRRVALIARASEGEGCGVPSLLSAREAIMKKVVCREGHIEALQEHLELAFVRNCSCS
jgi:hypothetical protein